MEFIKIFSNYLFYVFIQKEEEETHREVSSLYWFTSYMAATTKTGSGWNQKSGRHPEFLTWVQESICLRRPSLPSQAHRQTAGLEAEHQTQPSTLRWDVDVTHSSLTHLPNALNFESFIYI